MSKFTHSRRRSSEQGYILLTLMLVATVLAITLIAVLPDVMQEAKRDREEELIHRGVQYSRAIKKYVKKFGNYPTSLDALDNTNQIRFLRKRYKDPITGKDFKLLHQGEVQTTFGGGLAGASPIAGRPGAAFGAGNFGGGNRLAAQASTGLTGIGSGFGTPSGFGTSSATGPQTQGQNGQAQAGQGQNGQGDQDQNGQGSDSDKDKDKDSLAGKTFGGGPIVGVVSTSKDKSIREFNKKDHYNQWQFIYDPTTDRGGLLTTPNQPPLQGAGTLAGQVPGQPGQPGQPTQGLTPGQSGQGQGFPQQPPQVPEIQQPPQQ